ncbi:MAG TPA: MFS transporter [Alphaproteobacteria bacterium]|nr:MFS transporter [Alphaproteobacteria bacterium]HIB17823.1 MFS transporter [Alphaproteobacteria bacterium]HIB55388.1 MFS transporter [Alphaproteobacteria bacterium]HIN91817.1 MFS transporter [Alphaproteobacteria bacterium]HIO03159.1 MFS transporter [Alphaproteobacteria bacterium]
MTHPSTPPKHFKVVGLVSTGHFLSHFYMLLIPPLFPLLKDEFGIGFTELGITITVFSLVTGLTQAPVGFLVDRFGARKILLCGLLLESAAFIWIGLSPSYWMLLAMMGVAGLANAVYHPANYAILNASVQSGRIGQAFSIHTAAGMLGNAVAPVTMVLLLSVTDWKTGLIVCGVTGGLASVLIAANAGALQETASQTEIKQPSTARSGLRLLFSQPILLGALFFLCIGVAGHGVSAFGVATLTVIHEITVTEAATILSAYLFASPIGVLCGGWIADRIRHHHLFAGVCFVAIALAFFTMAGLSMRLEVIAFVFVIAGFFSGVVSPSRDMLIRSLAPPTEMGKVFGFVSTGFNVAGIIAPPLFGYILDHHNPSAVFWTVGAVSLLTVLTVVTTGQKRERNLA